MLEASGGPASVYFATKGGWGKKFWDSSVAVGPGGAGHLC